MKRKLVSMSLIASLLCTSLTPVITSASEFKKTSEVITEKDLTREGIEKLKKQLQYEIDHYWEIQNAFFGYDDSEVIFNSTYGANCIDYEEAELAGDYVVDYYPDIAMQSAMVSKSAQSTYWDIGGFNTEEYNQVKPDNFMSVLTDPLSTFAADVDTGSYCNLRRMILEDGMKLDEIPSGSVRTEEMLNYFDYQVEEQSDKPFSVQYETADCPWNETSKLLLMTIQAQKAEKNEKGNNFVYLIDTSGSMDEAEKLGLARAAFKLLTYTLDEKDRVSIVTYAGDSYCPLDSCKGSDYEKIWDTLDNIYTYGGTNGSGGIEKAYEVAEANFIEGGNNRVFIASDGDMNLGITSQAGLVDLIKEKKESGIFLTTMGFGSGNYSDANMEQIADAGNGNYFYIDCLDEAENVLVHKQKETTVTVAKDVKFQVEFNPENVAEYRLLGYENREVADNDFQNDAVDGGEVGSGQQVTVLYELKAPVKSETGNAGLKYQGNRELTDAAHSDELLTLSINYKNPDEDTSTTEEYTVAEDETENSPDMNLAISIAELSMIIHNDMNMCNSTLDDVVEYAKKSLGEDPDMNRIGYAYIVDKLN